MATADQITSLIKSHFEQDPERFNSLALQVAAHEAQQGHLSLANEIKGIIDSNRKRNSLKFGSV